MGQDTLGPKLWPGPFTGQLTNSHAERGYGFVAMKSIKLQAGGVWPKDLVIERDLFLHVRDNPKLGDPLPGPGTWLRFSIQLSVRGKREIQVYNAEVIPAP